MTEISETELENMLKSLEPVNLTEKPNVIVVQAPTSTPPPTVTSNANVSSQGGRMPRGPLTEEQKAKMKAGREKKKLEQQQAAERQKQELEKAQRKALREAKKAAGAPVSSAIVPSASTGNKIRKPREVKNGVVPIAMRAKLYQVGSSAAGGFVIGKYNQMWLGFVGNDRSSFAYKYLRPGLLVAAALYGNKFLPKGIANDPNFNAALHGAIGAMAAEIDIGQLAKDLKMSGVESLPSRSLAEVSGISEFELMSNAGVLPLRIADSLARSYIKSVQEGDNHAAKVLTQMSGMDLSPAQREAAKAVERRVESRRNVGTINLESLLSE